MRAVFLRLLALCAFASTTRAMAADLDPLMGRLDFAPYRVAVSLSFDSDPSITPGYRRSIAASLADQLTRAFGQTWLLVNERAIADGAVTPATIEGLERLDGPAAARLCKEPCDKVYNLIVERQGPRWNVAGREWDVSTETMSDVAVAAVVDRGDVAAAFFDLVVKLHTPIMVVEEADAVAKRAVLSIRAGSISLGDPGLNRFAVGSVLEPVFRYLDATKTATKIQRIPWTYLRIESISGGRATCTIHSAFRTPMAGNMRRRVEAVAMLVKAPYPSSRVELVRGRVSPQPVGGVFVTAAPLLPPIPADAAPHADIAQPAAVPPTKYLSDRQGMVELPADPKQPLRSIEVRSGTALLARRPFIPGTVREILLDLPDDRLRLNTERELDVMRDQLVETVARRSALIGRAKALVKKNDADGVKQTITEVERLPDAPQYQAQLNQIRVIGVEAARRAKDKVSEKRINDLCDKVAELIVKYLPEEKVKTFKEEIGELQQGQRDAAAAKAAVSAAPKQGTAPALSGKQAPQPNSPPAGKLKSAGPSGQ